MKLVMDEHEQSWNSDSVTIGRAKRLWVLSYFPIETVPSGYDVLLYYVQPLPSRLRKERYEWTFEKEWPGVCIMKAKHRLGRNLGFCSCRVENFLYLAVRPIMGNRSAVQWISREEINASFSITRETQHVSFERFEIACPSYSLKSLCELLENFRNKDSPVATFIAKAVTFIAYEIPSLSHFSQKPTTYLNEHEHVN
uniref:Uncharacterized protein n=1 Tax=Vespula pensylvanica TaxID=30213 RepID=A0A834P5X7_VESPE|nr:hypothetical protein H0235_006107 [Vespula pensylvanica]